MKCIDLYSGIGGWTLGMKLAGVEHVASYEWNPESNRTHNLNFDTDNAEIDIRALELSSLPKPGTIDIVVGSPPCTQFSFSNRGGRGNIEDGLVDLHKFLSVVEYLKPRYWVMENVPRVRSILNELVEGHPDFIPFQKLITFNEVVNSWEYGTPQKRKRMICGNFPYEYLLTYRDQCPRYSIDDALAQLTSGARIDELYGWPKGKLVDHEKETPLSSEEIRINREAKLYHPVYNKMSFPDSRSNPARTVTSLCTRVSRESIIIEDAGEYRRLSVRERGVLMGFPVNYQFYGNSYSAKLKMIGNSIPPPLTYHIFNAMQEKSYAPLRHQRTYVHKIPVEPVLATPPPFPRQMFKSNRSYRMCVTGYRFGSGVRFELSNLNRVWRVRFFYGSSTSIHEKILDKKLEDELRASLPKRVFLKLPTRLKSHSSEKIQTAWTGHNGPHPFTITDALGLYGERIESNLKDIDVLEDLVNKLLSGKVNRSLTENPRKTITGLILGIAFNENIAERDKNAD
jgi:DNA (cytosine-5)-methyltransferase 1